MSPSRPLPRWPLAPLTLALFAVPALADTRPAALPDQVITANPLGEVQPAAPAACCRAMS